MRPTRYKREYAVAQTVADMKRQFVYPDEDTQPRNPLVGGGGGMAHYLVVSTSEPQSVQDKADYLVPDENSAQALQGAFDAIGAATGNAALASVWMAGVFDLDSNVTTPSGAWIRGLGYSGSAE